jgi:hypothetical protein
MKSRLGWGVRSFETWTLCAIGLAIAAAGCGSSNSSGASIATACAAVAAARCGQASLCSLPDGEPGTGYNILENYGDMPTCVAQQTTNCTNALMAPQNGNNPTLVENCVSALAGSSCQDFFDNLPPAACTPTGPRANDAPCTFNGQCMSGYCNGTKTSVCGTCGPAPAVGADCTSSTCAYGDRCVAAVSACEAVVSTNQSCDPSNPCDRGLSCVGEDTKTMTAGTCETAGTRIGVPCGGTMPGCDPTRGLYCGGPTGAKTCQRVVYPNYNGSVADGGSVATDGGSDGGTAPTPTGTPCGTLADGSHVGCVAGNCYEPSGSNMGTCKELAHNGDTCDTSVGPGCMFPARCVTGGGDGSTSGTCVVPIATVCPSS